MYWLAPPLLLHWARRTINGEGRISAVKAAHGSCMLKLVSAVEAMLNSSARTTREADPTQVGDARDLIILFSHLSNVLCMQFRATCARGDLFRSARTFMPGHDNLCQLMVLRNLEFTLVPSESVVNPILDRGS
ncbi:hypothetical protein HAX54_015572 [Datura stramonium]|uniref:Uncharacterized protein n=1 Tax=Datura stramonium TaxID=4076 RepID=A0ABS8RFW9_DATST|nr:hypothetical protein [Datura stramonium]